MSRELIFYPGFKEKDTGLYRPLCFNVNGEPADVYWRSRSFIDCDFFTDFRMIRGDEFHPCCSEYFANRYNDFFEEDSGDVPTHVYGISEKELHDAGKTMGLLNGYALIEDIYGYYTSDFKSEYLSCEMRSIIPAEVYAEMSDDDRKKYGRFAVVDTCSSSYICNLLGEFLSDAYVPYDWEGEKCMIMVDSF